MLPSGVPEKMGVGEFQKEFSKIPVCTMEELVGADVVVVGTPTRYGNMCGQMRQFFDATGRSPGGRMRANWLQPGSRDDMSQRLQNDLHGSTIS